MASNTSEKEIFDDSLTEDQNERSHLSSSVRFDVSNAEERQPVQESTLTVEADEASEASDSEIKDALIHIENNYGILSLSAGTLVASNVKALSSNERTIMLKITVNIGRNDGVVVIGNIQLNSDQFNVQSSKTKEEPKTKIQCEQLDIIPSSEPGTGDGCQSHKSVKDDSVNRSEFCHASVLV